MPGHKLSRCEMLTGDIKGQFCAFPVYIKMKLKYLLSYRQEFSLLADIAKAVWLSRKKGGGLAVEGMF